MVKLVTHRKLSVTDLSESVVLISFVICRGWDCKHVIS